MGKPVLLAFGASLANRPGRAKTDLLQSATKSPKFGVDECGFARIGINPQSRLACRAGPIAAHKNEKARSTPSRPGPLVAAHLRATSNVDDAPRIHSKKLTRETKNMKKALFYFAPDDCSPFVRGTITTAFH